LTRAEHVQPDRERIIRVAEGLVLKFEGGPRREPRDVQWAWSPGGGHRVRGGGGGGRC